jgi:hypothetical protein
VRTDNGHGFQAKFQLARRGAKLTSAQWQVELSHRTDEQEFYQPLTYTRDVDLHQKLAEWEHFHNLSRPHGALDGKAPYEALRERL